MHPWIIRLRSRSLILLIGLTTFSFGLATAAAQTITVWEHELPEIQASLDKLIASYQAANPGVTVKRAHYKTEDLRTQYQTAAMARGGPDLVLGPNDFAGPFSIMGIVQPVNDFGGLEQFTPDVVQAVTSADGKTWGVPVSKGNHLMLFVNANLLAKAPATIEELIAAAKKITDKSKKVYGLAYNLTEPFFFVPFMGLYGERPLNETAPNLSGAGMIEALNLVKQMKFTDKIVPEDCDYACADTLFNEGKAAMVINGDWAVQKYRETFKDKLLIAPLPKLETTGKHMAPMISGKYLFVNRNVTGKQKEAVAKFVEYLASASVQEQILKETGRLPSHKAVAESEAIKTDPVLAATFKAMEHGQPMPMAVEMRAVWDAIRPQLQAVMAGRSEAKVAATVMQKDAETKIKEMRQ